MIKLKAERNASKSSTLLTPLSQVVVLISGRYIWKNPPNFGQNERS